MWLFTVHGYFSVVVSKEEPGKIMVRARALEHMVSLIEQIKENIPTIYAEHHRTPDADYPHRLIMSQNDWMHVAEMLAEEIDYTNFKDEVFSVNSNRLVKWPVWLRNQYLGLLGWIWQQSQTMSIPPTFSKPEPKKRKPNGRRR